LIPSCYSVSLGFEENDDARIAVTPVEPKKGNRGGISPEEAGE
jgi:hypothetical protein